MFEQYQATQTDFDTIEEALSFVWKPELDFNFRDKLKIHSTIVATYDSVNVYYWIKEDGQYHKHQFTHPVKIKEEHYRGWCTGCMVKELKPLLIEQLPGEYHNIISGAPLTPIITLQKQRQLEANPYTTYESYLATIVHEFGHIYYNNTHPSFFKSQSESIPLMQIAQVLFAGKEETPDVPVPMLSHRSISELFAFCTDYTAAKIFWPHHKKDLDKYHQRHVEKGIQKEKEKNLLYEDSYLNEGHNYAAVVGKILLEQYPESWVTLLLGHTDEKLERA